MPVHGGLGTVAWFLQTGEHDFTTVQFAHETPKDLIQVSILQSHQHLV